jgi:high-affinity iron transporter
VISYNCYWIVVIGGFFLMRYKETTGHLPFMKAKPIEDEESNDGSIKVESNASSGLFESNSQDKTAREKTLGIHAVPTAGTSSE